MKSSIAMAAIMAAVADSGSIGASALAFTRFSNPLHEAPAYRRTKYSRSTQGKPSPAGSKLARKAAKGKVGVR